MLYSGLCVGGPLNNTYLHHDDTIYVGEDFNYILTDTKIGKVWLSSKYVKLLKCFATNDEPEIIQPIIYTTALIHDGLIEIP